MAFDAAIALGAGLWATVVLTMIMTLSLSAGWTHLDFGRLLGGIVDGIGVRGALVGLCLHSLVGLMFALAYSALFAELGIPAQPGAAAGFGACVGVYHWLLSMPLIGMGRALNPHIRSGQLPDPGAWGIHFGPQEAIVRLVAHVAYGITMGGLSAILHIGTERHLPGLPWALVTGLVALTGVIAFHLTCLSPALMPRVTFEPAEDREIEHREQERQELLERYKRGDMSWEDYQRERRALASEP